jgi:hypothetical protein
VSISELQTRLTEVQGAISDLVASRVQSYTTTAGGQVQRLSLNELRAYETDLRKQIARATRGRFAHMRREVMR